MPKQIPLGDLAIDHFPVFEDDGYTKKSGETIFTPTIRKDAVDQAVPMTITEIGVTGEYKAEFLPTSEGLWSSEILINYNKQIWYAEFQVGGEPVIWQASMADDGSNAVFGIWLEQSGERRTDITSMTATLRDTTGALIVNLGAGSPSGDGVFRFTTPSSNLDIQVPYYIAAVATDGTQTWRNNLGVAKSD